MCVSRETANIFFYLSPKLWWRYKWRIKGLPKDIIKCFKSEYFMLDSFGWIPCLFKGHTPELNICEGKDYWHCTKCHRYITPPKWSKH